MKKYLYGTTILTAMGLVVGPALAEEKPISLSVGGFYKQFVALGLKKVEGKNKVSVWQNSEVHFKFSGEFANGIKVGGRIELESQTEGDDRIDQAYVDLEGGFGKLRIGSINSGRYAMTIYAPEAGTMNSADQAYGKYMKNAIGDGVNNAANYDFSGDAQKLTYFTPRFSGFQGALSYAPNGGQGGNGGKVLFSSTDKAKEYSDAWDMGLSYKGSFDAVEISAMAGVGGAKAPSNAKAAGFKDFRMYNLGLQFSSHGFTVGAAYTIVDKGKYEKKVTDRKTKLVYGDGPVVVDSGVTTAVEELKVTDIISNKGHGFTVGAKYADGPWAVSVNMTKGRSEGLISKQTGTAEAVVTSKGKKDKVTAYAVGASYQIGPGVVVKLGYSHTTEKNEADKKTTGSAVMGGIVLGF